MTAPSFPDPGDWITQLLQSPIWLATAGPSRGDSAFAPWIQAGQSLLDGYSMPVSGVLLGTSEALQMPVGHHSVKR